MSLQLVIHAELSEKQIRKLQINKIQIMDYIKTSKFLALILRHKPEKIGITLHEHGWADVDELIEKTIQSGRELDKESLEYIVRTNDKKRYAFNEDHTKIRASQGHTIPVDVKLKDTIPPDSLYHGMKVDYLPLIMECGLLKMKRLCVHLSNDVGTAIKVGQRHGNPVVLLVNSGRMYKDGYRFYLSVNGVWLTDHVPAEYLKRI